MNWRQTVIAVLVIALAGAITVRVLVGPRKPLSHNHFIPNEKQQALALAIYATDNDGRLPKAEVWMDAALVYTKSKKLFQDPSLQERLPGEYGFAFFEPLSEAVYDSIEEPESVPLTFQSKDKSWNAYGGLELLDRRLKDGKAFVAFADSHRVIVDRDWPAGPIVLRFKEKTD
jgi:hypothetical protein